MNDSKQQISKLGAIAHPEFGKVRSVTIKDETWFVAKDICDILGLVKYRDAMTRLDSDEKGRPVLMDTPGGKQEMATVNESGMYSLIFQSRKAEAKQFRKWVTSEVLPAIRRQGFYIHPSAMLTVNETKRLQKIMRTNVARFIIAEDVRRCARRFGVPEYVVQSILRGERNNNDVMLDLQTRALVNQQKWNNAYSVERMREVTEALTK